MSESSRLPALVIAFAALNGAVAVAVGAAAAHVAGEVPNARELLRTGSDYQLWHALALIATALIMTRASGWARRLAAAAAGAFALGVLLFSLSLYWAAALGGRAALAPFGGTSLILGWLALAGAGLGAAAARRPPA